MGLTSALAVAGQTLELMTAGIQVAGQNISNANNPEYIREKLVVSTSPSYRQGNLILGSGAEAVGVQQQINKFLELRLHAANSEAAGAESRNAIYKQLESALQELSESDLSTGLTKFLGSLQDVTNQPEVEAYRQVAILAGQDFANEVRSVRQRIDTLREAQNSEVDNLVREANDLIDQIAKLNSQILKSESAGLLASEAGSLRNARYNALNRLSEILPVRASEQPSGVFDVFLGSDYLVLGTKTNHLETSTEVDRDLLVKQVRVEGSLNFISGSAGELNGVIGGRDNVLGSYLDQLDTFVSGVISEFNKIHSSGEGTDGFNSVTSVNQVQDVNAALNAAGLQFSPVHGSFQVKVTNQATGIATTSTIAIDADGLGTETSLEDLRAALDAVANVTANISTDRRLVISAANGFDLRFGQDTSGALAALGVNTFFTGSSSSNIGVNSTVLNQAGLFAAGRGAGPGDNSNVVALLQFADRPVQALGGISVMSQYSRTIAQLAQDSAAEAAVSEGFSAYRDALYAQRSQLSGVSLDEEALSVMEFQRAYQAAARIVSVVDQLFDTLLSI